MSVSGRRVGLGILLLLASVPRARAVEPEETTKLDCGVNALFVLLQLEGRPVTLDRLQAALPARHPDGYSMAELAAASQSLGLRLEGVKFGGGDKPLEHPSIVFLQDGKAGHFAVLRPVGSTGKMVQVIDPPSAPWIGDYARVLSTKPWTGRILTPRNNTRRWGTVVAATAGVALLTLAGLRWRRSRIAVLLQLPVERPLADA